MSTESRKDEPSEGATNITHFNAPVTGQIHTGSGDIIIGQSGNDNDGEIAKAFALLIQKVSSLPESPEKTVAQGAIQALEVEAKKGAEAQENTVYKWVHFLAETSPDIWQVTVDTFVNPIKGLSTVFQKISERAKVERKAKKESDIKASQEQQ